jgi:hypothetical protein
MSGKAHLGIRKHTQSLENRQQIEKKSRKKIVKERKVTSEKRRG